MSLDILGSITQPNSFRHILGIFWVSPSGHAEPLRLAPGAFIPCSLQDVSAQILILHDGRYHLLYIRRINGECLLWTGGGHALLVGKRR